MAKHFIDTTEFIEDPRDLFSVSNLKAVMLAKWRAILSRVGDLNLKCEARESTVDDTLKAQNIVVTILQINSSRKLRENISTTIASCFNRGEGGETAFGLDRNLD